jgi:phospholipid transport system substrate-binding protein
VRTNFRLTIPALLALAVTAGAPQAYSMNFEVAPQQNLLINVADDAKLEGAKNMITAMTQKGVSFLGDTSLNDEQRAAEFRKLLNENFDMAAIGRFALGRNWKTATPAQQTEYQKLFKDMIVKTYSRRFKEYNGQEVKVQSARADGETDIIVSSTIVPPSGPSVAVDWRVRQISGGYKVVDILVEGVSMALTQRSDFASVIQRGGGNIEVLLEQLRQR